MELSKLEKQIIESFRNGGTIDIWHLDVPTYKEAIDCIQEFGEITDVNEHDSRVTFIHRKDDVVVYSSVYKDARSE